MARAFWAIHEGISLLNFGIEFNPLTSSPNVFHGRLPLNVRELAPRR